LPRSSSDSSSRRVRGQQANILIAVIGLIIILATSVTIVYILPVQFGKNVELYGNTTVVDSNGNTITGTQQLSLSNIYNTSSGRSGSITNSIYFRPLANTSTSANLSDLTWQIHCGLELEIDGMPYGNYQCGASGTGSFPASILIGNMTLSGSQLYSIVGNTPATHTITFLSNGGTLTLSYTDCSQCSQTVVWPATTLQSFTVVVQ